MMGGGPDSPAAESKKEVLLVLFPAPESNMAPSLDKIKKKFPKLEVEYVNATTTAVWDHEAGIPEDVYERATIIATVAALPPTPSLAPNLGLIQFFSAGINHVMKHPIYTDSKIPLCTATGIHGPQIAEWVILTTLVQSHGYNDLYEAQKKHAWKKDNGAGSVRDLPGQRVGVLGYGSIGRQVARVAQALGMDVIAYTASPRTTPESKKDKGFIVPGTGDPDGSIPSAWYSGTSKEALHAFLKLEIDLLVISVPLTPATFHFLSTPEFDLLAASNPNLSYIANISRGDIIDQPALIDALKSKKLRGAAVDVTSPEPLPEDHPLWEAPNLVLTPHISSNSSRYMERAFQLLEANIGKKERGEGLINEVDRKRGY
ncbi:uncharacterized protein BDZ99DRAFT_449652 [Mytilinidion resinicola]|uniref:D-isomer specific 2-hydroxyacid dehydrogenase NAD-binding domain-containing protein n=1 Tax=Mytilinidion resinicola TaxID=574789 RepID=A0A6A6YAX0_9PEZI|nr:uncharacterized protein BDZ99DRAFT_449652 [Mytilinidion resinicola]KAF2805962.1 hypothetical protein BDZ99DRAFT_449652 [Mytilinidion resinicola]